MRETTVRVEHEQAVDAAPEKVWALAGDTAALSARPTWFAFGIPATVAGTDRLCGVIAAGEVIGGALLGVREETPGHAICWETVSPQSGDNRLFSLSVRPQRHGSALRVAVSHVVPRFSKNRYESYWQAQARTWTDRLREVIEGRAPWPREAMPAQMQQRCSFRPPLDRPQQVSAAVLINAPVEAVWEMVWAPETGRLAEPEAVAYAGHVPGTPQREVGEMQYTVQRNPDDRFLLAVYVVRDLEAGRSAVTQHLGPPYDETFHVLTPVPGGTRLELTHRLSERAARTYGKKVVATLGESLQATADGYKRVIEAADGG